MHSRCVVIFILLNFEHGNFRPVDNKCNWSVEHSYCPLYGTTDWECLKDQLNCSSGKDYHCVRDERGKWIQICAEAKTCHKGHEPVYSKVSGITCQSCSNPERFEPAESTASYKFSECQRIKKTCPEDISHECPDETVRYVQNRMCRCANEKNFIPQNYDFDTETWICKDIDDLNCVEDACPEDANGKEQIRGREYRCYVPPFVPATPSPADRSSPGVISEKPTTRLNRMAGPVEGDKGSPGLIIGLILCMLGLLLILVVILTVYKLKKRNQLGTPVGLKATDITYYTLMLSWEPPKKKKKGYLPTHYILEKREAKSLIWFRIVTILAEKTDYHVTGLKAGTRYSFSVVAKHNKGKSKRHETESQVLTKCITVPEMPRRLSGYFDENAKRIQLRWDPPADDGGTQIHEYIVEYSSDGEWILGGSVNKGTTEWTQSDLIGGVMYKFRVFAHNEQGQSKPAEISEKIQYMSVPSKPVDVRITDIKGNKLTLNWSSPESEGGTIIRKYCIRQKQDDFDWEIIHEVFSPTLSKTITNLNPDKAYNFGVRAENKIGKSDFEDMERPIGPPDIPAGPLKASNIEYTVLTLSWLPPEYDGGSQLTGYIIEKKDQTIWGSIGTHPPEKTQFHVKGLNSGTRYSFCVSAKNAFGTSKHLEIDEQVTTYEITKPEKPDGPIEYSNMTSKSVTVSWKPPKDDCGSPLTGYAIYIRDACNKRDTNWTRCERVKDTTWTKKNLSVDGEYAFRVCAINAKGESEPLQSSDLFKPKQHLTPPPPIGPIEYSELTECSVRLTWKPPETEASSLTGYTIEYRDISETFTTWKMAGPVSADKTTWVQHGLKEDHKYQFRIICNNAIGNIEPFEANQLVIPKRSLCPPDPPLGPLEASDVQFTELTLSWKQPDYDGGSQLTGYSVEKDKRILDRTKFTTYRVQALQDGTKYQFAVKAINLRGYSQPLEIDVTTKSATKPGPPVGPVKYTKLTANSVTVSWNPSDNDGGSPITDYYVEKCDVPSNNRTVAQSVSKDITTLTQTELIEGSEYRFRIYANNSKGESVPLESKTIVISKRPIAVPRKPECLNVKDSEEDSLILAWKPPKNDGGSKILKYHIYMEKKKIESVDADINEYLVKKLSLDKKYTFQVRASNTAGHGDPSEITS